MTHWTLLLTIASIIGTVANVYQKRWCFGVWLFTNTAWCAWDLHIGQWPQAMLFGVYVGLAVWGLVKWRQTPAT